MKNNEDVIREILKEKYKILNIYTFGSYLYGCENDESDFDFIIIVDGDYFDGSKEFSKGKYNLNLYHLEFFKFILQDQAVEPLTCLWIPEELCKLTIT